MPLRCTLRASIWIWLFLIGIVRLMHLMNGFLYLMRLAVSSFQAYHLYAENMQTTYEAW